MTQFLAHAFATLGHALRMATAMFWETFWALVIGFGISAALQVFVSKERMKQAFGRPNLKTILTATGLGAASSSCSYAAVAIGRSAFQQGASLVVAFAFMFASTNLVVELGVVLWLLMGWRFVLAEVVGAFVLIAMMWLLMSIFFAKKLEAEALQHASGKEEDSCHDGHEHRPDVNQGKWTRVATAFLRDWQMLWKEILAGFLIAGLLSALVPRDWWKALFIQSGNESLRLIENAAVGPVIAILSFVCSVGNIPLASLLWSNGISFGGVISFIYADLLVVPIILIYLKYFGGRATICIVCIFYASMVASGIIVDVLFAATGLIPRGPRPPAAIEHATIHWNYTTWLDLIALAIALLFFSLAIRRRHPAS
ncbi:MAG TPA: permease [Chthoniobacterales bacterium]|nr:permease [Chthoniobacterales bacterium]